MEIEVSDQKFIDFRPTTESSGCFLEIENRLLLVQQAPGQPSEGCWAVPAGRLEPNEEPEMTAKRELWEETGIELPSYSSLIHLRTLYIPVPPQRHPSKPIQSY